MRRRKKYFISEMKNKTPDGKAEKVLHKRDEKQNYLLEGGKSTS